MQVFVIGGAGYIGTSAIAALQKQGHQVIALIRSKAQQSTLKNLGVEPLLGDLADIKDWSSSLQESDAVIYTAAGQSETYTQLEQQAVQHILHVLEGSEKPFVKVTGSMVFGDTGTEGKAEAADFNPPPPLVGAAALATTIKAFAKRGVRTIQIFPSYVYGHGGGDIPTLMLAIAKQYQKGVYVADGAALWSMVHVDDVGALIAVAMKHAAAGSVVFPAGPAMSIQAIAQTIANAIGGNETIGLTMDAAQEELGFFAVPLTLNQVFSDRIAYQLGWQPQGLPLAEALQQEYEL